MRYESDDDATDVVKTVIKIVPFRGKNSCVFLNMTKIRDSAILKLIKNE
ncbi:hypothetical protein DFA_05029 [Cavenderia fasciculata]|uniref:Uncharacterized protein n=1 Tax=Cavenderia fasciculata TaxID=261658 RepID=F4PN06_CACFS|nr:uncharacterized protein DFA_05029 [Cavenderia fasciculata]EGG22899.1 hypothetical protein DFA_05029 [Cavenderia fasciculata]|eukprot:XP_004360750.1 hypothetical protein DFA_05029 [Cavenderia fasciculata]